MCFVSPGLEILIETFFSPHFHSQREFRLPFVCKCLQHLFLIPLCVCVSSIFFSPCVSLLFPGVNVLCVILCIWEWLKTPMPVAAFCINPQVCSKFVVHLPTALKLASSSPFPLNASAPPFYTYPTSFLSASYLSYSPWLTHAATGLNQFLFTVKMKVNKA